MSRVLVTGGTGAVGPEVLRALAADGHAVRLLARGPVPADVAAHTSEIVTGDITTAADLARSVRDCDAVVHLAALLHQTGPVAPPEADYERQNVDATRALLAAAREAGVRQFVLASTIAVYGEAPRGVADEGTPARPETPYARTKLAAERLALTAFTGEGRSAVVLRLAAVYGSRMKGNYRQLVLALARGRFIAPGAGRNRRSLVHDSDVAAAFARAVAHPAATGRVFNVANRTAHPLSEVIDAIAIALGRRRARLYLPQPLALAAAAAVETAARLTGRHAPLTRRMVRRYNEEIAVDARAIARDLDFVPRMPLVQGWQVTVDRMRELGELSG